MRCPALRLPDTQKSRYGRVQARGTLGGTRARPTVAKIVFDTI
jgi:hypothetical protein